VFVGGVRLGVWGVVLVVCVCVGVGGVVLCRCSVGGCDLLIFLHGVSIAQVPRGEEGARLADLECVADIRTLLESLKSCAAARESV